MAMDLDQFHEVFFTESFDALDQMEGALLKLSPGSPDLETVNTIFRVAHSIKGGAGMFGFGEIASFTHTLETLLDELRAARIEVSAEMCDALLQSVDQIRMMMSAIQRHDDASPEGAAALQDTLRRMVTPGTGPVSKPSSQAPAVQVSAVPRETNSSDNGPDSKWTIRFRPFPELLVRGNDPLRIFAELAALGELEVTSDLSGLPSLERMELDKSYLAWTLKLGTPCSRAAVAAAFEWAEGDCELSLEPLPDESVVAATAPAVPSPAAPPAAQTRPAAGGATHSTEASSIRVSIDKIDELLNTVGEIVITQSMLNQLAAKTSGDNSDRLRTGLDQLESYIRELQESVMRIRMLPVGSVFSRFPRLVRDLSHRLGKQIRLQISGEQTEIDKTVLEKIGDPLVHLVRNSIDHGIEDPATRLAQGKPAEGTVHLNAFHKGGSISIVISDDGKGLDKGRIVEKARSKGLIDEGAVLTDEQVHDLIFEPGFSTAAQTTDLSGRGVGMDVVRRNIKELGGSVELKSELGRGTTTTITLPLTLAIVDGQSVTVGTETYIVPLVVIVESLQVKPGAVTPLHERGEVFSFRGDYLPVIRLHEVFGVEPRSRSLAEGLIMVVEGDGRRAGLFIDELMGQQQVVIKSMETNYTRIDGIGGATILGEGTVALIIDVPGLLRMAHSSAGMRRTGS